MNDKRAGVTLIEMLVVVVIIAVFAAVVGPRLLNQGDKARVVAAKQQIENYGLALGQYHLDTGGYPSSDQGLAALRVQPSGVEQWHGPYLQKDVANDPWGHPYMYKFPGDHGDEPDIVSYGADGQPGGDGLNSDIVSLEVKQLSDTRQPARSGVTLIEMLIVVTIIAIMAGVSFPAITAGLSGVRLVSASGSVASFLTSSMNQVERREQPAAVQITPTAFGLYTAASGERPERFLELPPGITVEGPFPPEGPRRFILQPGGAVPRISLILRNDKGARRSIRIDPTTGVPDIRRVEEQPQ